MGERVFHGIAPVFDSASRLLILGSFPSVKSREVGFYYGHPQNRFWRVLASLKQAPLPESTEEKKALLLKNGLALWDVAASCEIHGSADASIRGVAPNALDCIFSAAPIERVVTNGGTAHRLYAKFRREFGWPEDIPLPSTSPANARMSFPALLELWAEALTL